MTAEADDDEEEEKKSSSNDGVVRESYRKFGCHGLCPGEQAILTGLSLLGSTISTGEVQLTNLANLRDQVKQ